MWMFYFLARYTFREQASVFSQTSLTLGPSCCACATRTSDASIDAEEEDAVDIYVVVIYIFVWRHNYYIYLLEQGAHKNHHVYRPACIYRNA
ncbi:hypothetical protein ACJX0J_009901, partial [Zea mays]